MKLYSTLSLIIKIQAGSDIETACIDLCKMSRNLSRTIKSNFNGIILEAGTATNPLDLVNKYYKKLYNNSCQCCPFKIGTTNKQGIL